MATPRFNKLAVPEAEDLGAVSPIIDTPGKPVVLSAFWSSILNKAKKLPDPWKKHHIEQYDTEPALEHIYDATNDSWQTNRVFVKVAPEPFAAGAQRSCFRMKLFDEIDLEDHVAEREQPIHCAIDGIGERSARKIAARLKIPNQFGALLDELDKDEGQLRIVFKVVYSKEQRKRVKQQLFLALRRQRAVDNDWAEASNYVAKLYMNEQPREVYEQDVQVQMKCKEAAKFYNARKPPKKVDMLVAVLIEMVERPGSPLYCVERFIVGRYAKYNSNCGYVKGLTTPMAAAAAAAKPSPSPSPAPPPPSLSAESATRNTPQAFSHFTFEQSRHSSIIVDVQGVGDLYTDPQLHTVSDDAARGAAAPVSTTGDMGLQGMALFFASHVCNPLCTWLQLPPFALSPLESARLSLISSPHRARGLSGGGGGGGVPMTTPAPHLGFSLPSPANANAAAGATGSLLDFSAPVPPTPPAAPAGRLTFADDAVATPILAQLPPRPPQRQQQNGAAPTPVAASECKEASAEEGSSNSSGGGSGGSGEAEAVAEATAEAEAEEAAAAEASSARILALVHLELSRLHCQPEQLRPIAMGLHLVQGMPDFESAEFHLRQAALSGHVPSACIALARGYAALMQPLVEGLEVKPSRQQHRRFLRLAAEGGDAGSMAQLAKSLAAAPSSASATTDYRQAAEWYRRAVQAVGTSGPPVASKHAELGGAGPPPPRYELHASLAELLASGDATLPADTAAARAQLALASESALQCMKGRLVMRYEARIEELLAADEASQAGQTE